MDEIPSIKWSALPWSEWQTMEDLRSTYSAYEPKPIVFANPLIGLILGLSGDWFEGEFYRKYEPIGLSYIVYPSFQQRAKI